MPRELAVELARERDAYAEALGRERREVAKLEALLEAQRDEFELKLEAAEADAEAAVVEEVEEVVEVEAHEHELARLERRVEGLLGDIARLRRNQDAALEARGRAGARDALTGMLEVRDNMARALALLSGDGGPWEQGFAGVLGQLDDALARAGVCAFGEVGERFDPTVHEAVGLEAHEVLESGSVRRVERLGFRFEQDGTLLRPAQVVVTT